MARDARALRRARAAAKASAQGKTRVAPKAVRIAQRTAQDNYALSVATGQTPRPPKDSPEGKQLARMASLASKGEANARFETAFSAYWYHDDKPRESDDEYEEYQDYEDEEEEEEAEE